MPTRSEHCVFIQFQQNTDFSEYKLVILLHIVKNRKIYQSVDNDYDIIIGRNIGGYRCLLK